MSTKPKTAKPTPSLSAKLMKQAQKLTRFGEVVVKLDYLGRFSALAYPNSSDAQARAVAKLRAMGKESIDIHTATRLIDEEQARHVARTEGKTPEECLALLVERLQPEP